jgi:hypothetical protein
MEQTVSPTPNEGITMATYELLREVAGYRPGRHDNSGLRARLSGAKIEDRPIVSELRLAMEEREALTLPRKASRR